MIRVVLPAHLRTLVNLDREIRLDDIGFGPGDVTTRTLLDALEKRHPALGGTLRDRATGQRRPLVRFLTCGEDWSHQSLDAPLPAAVTAGQEPFVILGAIAGG